MAPAKKTAQKNADLPIEKCFWLCDGRVLKNFKDLGAALDKMEENIWKHHVTKDKNDFANWIEDVFGEKKLGRDVRSSRNAKSAAKKIKSKTGAKLWSFF